MAASNCSSTFRRFWLDRPSRLLRLRTYAPGTSTRIAISEASSAASRAASKKSGAAKRAGEARRARVQFVGDLAALPDPEQAAAGPVGDPHRPLGVEAPAVGRDLDLAEDVAHFAV